MKRHDLTWWINLKCQSLGPPAVLDTAVRPRNMGTQRFFSVVFPFTERAINRLGAPCFEKPCSSLFGLAPDARGFVVFSLWALSKDCPLSRHLVAHPALRHGGGEYRGHHLVPCACCIYLKLGLARGGARRS